MSSTGSYRRGVRTTALTVVLTLLVALPAAASGGRMSVKEHGSPTRELAEANWSAGAIRARSDKLERSFQVRATDRRSDDGGVVCVQIDQGDGDGGGPWKRQVRTCAKRDGRAVDVAAKLRWRAACDVRITVTVERGRVELGRQVERTACG